jgi:hypothetical protein
MKLRLKPIVNEHILHIERPDVNKRTLELYALINYGELRRKVGSSFSGAKSAGKLCELIQNGVTQVKIKGKTIRVKTPMCRALKKINNIEGN